MACAISYEPDVKPIILSLKEDTEDTAGPAEFLKLGMTEQDQLDTMPFVER